MRKEHLTTEDVAPLFSLCDELGMSGKDFIQKWGRIAKSDIEKQSIDKGLPRPDWDKIAATVDVAFDGLDLFSSIPEWKYWLACTILTGKTLAEQIEMCVNAEGIQHIKFTGTPSLKTLLMLGHIANNIRR